MDFCFKTTFYMCLHVTVDDKEFNSYLCNTVMMWALGEQPPRSRNNPPGRGTTPQVGEQPPVNGLKNLWRNLLFLFYKLNEHIDRTHLPHYMYFIPDLNVMMDIPESMFVIIREILYRHNHNLLSDISMACPDMSDGEEWGFITGVIGSNDRC